MHHWLHAFDKTCHGRQTKMFNDGEDRVVKYGLNSSDSYTSYFDCSMQDYSNTIANAFELLDIRIYDFLLTHWGWVTHKCVTKLTIIGPDNGLSPARRQAIIWTNAEILSIGPLGTNFNEMSIEIQTFSFKKIHLNMSSGKWRPFCLGLNVNCLHE